MILAYYRDKKTGRIVSHGELTTYPSLATAQAAAEKYNMQPDCNRTAYAVEIKEDSLEEYLLNYAKVQRNKIRETVQEALDAVNEINSLLQCLEV